MHSLPQTIDPFHSAQSAAIGNGTSGIQYAYLLNDSPISYYLVVWFWGVVGTFTSIGPVWFAQGQSAAGGVRGIPIVLNAAPPAGVIVTGQIATIPTSNKLVAAFLDGGALNFLAPLAILPPGWALNVADGTTVTTDAFGMAAYWEEVSPESLQRRLGQHVTP